MEITFSESYQTQAAGDIQAL